MSVLTSILFLLLSDSTKVQASSLYDQLKNPAREHIVKERLAGVNEEAARLIANDLKQILIQTPADGVLTIPEDALALFIYHLKISSSQIVGGRWIRQIRAFDATITAQMNLNERNFWTVMDRTLTERNLDRVRLLFPNLVGLIRRRRPGLTGAFLRILLAERKVEQAQLARDLEISQAWLSGFVTNVGSRETFDQDQAIALGVAAIVHYLDLPRGLEACIRNLRDR